MGIAIRIRDPEHKSFISMLRLQRQCHLVEPPTSGPSSTLLFSIRFVAQKKWKKGANRSLSCALMCVGGGELMMSMRRFKF
jgi:hypothetical protein